MKKIFLYLFLTISYIFFSQVYLTMADPSEEWNKKGSELYNQGKYEEAIKCFDKALEVEPKAFKIFTNKGNALYNLEKYEEALKCYDKAVTINSKYEKALYGKGCVLIALSRYKDSIECFDQILKINPSDKNTLSKKEEASDLLKQQHDNDTPENKVSELLNKANSYYDKGEYEKAIDYYDAVLVLSPTNTEAIVKKAKAEVLAEQKASTTPSPSPVSNGPDVSELIKKAGLYYSKGEYEKAIGIYEAILAIDPDNKEAIGKKAAAEALIKQSSITPTPETAINALTPTPKSGTSKKKSYMETVNGISFEMVYIEGGTFEMISPSAYNKYTATVKSFYIGKYEVTNKEFSAILPIYNRSKWTEPNYPVENVLYDDARRYCIELSKKTGKRYRLPGYEEWCYACCAGTTTKYYWGNEIDGDYCWYNANSDGHPHPVGQKKPNAWGLYDMSGNVWEWCEFIRLPAYGGSFSSKDCSSYIHAFPENDKYPNVGFRLIMEP